MTPAAAPPHTAAPTVPSTPPPFSRPMSASRCAHALKARRARSAVGLSLPPGAPPSAPTQRMPIKNAAGTTDGRRDQSCSSRASDHVEAPGGLRVAGAVIQGLYNALRAEQKLSVVQTY